MPDFIKIGIYSVQGSSIQHSKWDRAQLYNVLIWLVVVHSKNEENTTITRDIF